MGTEENSSSLMDIFMAIFDIFVMFMPTIGYLDTVRLMVVNKSPAAFSYNTCFILLSAHGLKLLYRLYHPYAARIFGQSVTQFSVAFLMAYLRYYYARQSGQRKQSNENRRFSHSDTILDVQTEKLSKFKYYFYMARTKTFSEFMTSFFLYTFIILNIFFISVTFFDETFVVDTLGVIANLIESTVSVPTFIKVVIHKNINSVSTLLILQFILGDIMKMALFILSHTPYSFIAGCCLQLTLDTILFFTYVRLLFCPLKGNLDQDENAVNSLLNPDDSFIVKSGTDISVDDKSFDTAEIEKGQQFNSLEIPQNDVDL